MCEFLLRIGVGLALAVVDSGRVGGRVRHLLLSRRMEGRRRECETRMNLSRQLQSETLKVTVKGEMGNGMHCLRPDLL